MTKTCSKCNKTKQLEQFVPRGEGFRSICRECDRKSRRIANMTQRQIDLQHKRDKRKHKRRLAANPNYYKDAYQSIKHSLSTRYSDYKRRAKKNGIAFTFTKPKFGSITSLPCEYCGRFTEGTDFCGIDRKNSKLGYTPKNCVPCCKSCNYAKHTSTHKEFINDTVVRYMHLKSTGQVNET